MKKIDTMRVVLITLLGIALVTTGLWTRGPTVAGPVAQEDTGTSIPYQGRLTGDDGQPVVDGFYDFTFEIYSVQSGGVPLWTEKQPGVAVRDGYFSVLLGSVTPLRPDALSGTYYLAVNVRGAGDAGFSTLDPRQQLVSFAPRLLQATCGVTAADHDHWGETWSGSGTGLTLESSNLYGVFGRSSTSNGVFGRSDGSGTYAAAGVYGLGAMTSGQNAGVYGQSYSTSGVGVRGYASATSGFTYGVYGETNSSTALASGVYGRTTVGPTNGVRGETSSSTDNATGVFGQATATSGKTYGLYGKINSTTAGSAAVYGYAARSQGDIKGVAGISDSCNGGAAVAGVSWCSRHAGWFETGDWESVHMLSNSSTYATLWLDNSNASGSTFVAANGADAEMWLDGTGNLYIDGALNDNQGDYADMLPAVEGLEAGDVLVIGPDGKLTRSTQPNQTAVAGVYSTDPGIVGRPFNPLYDEDDPHAKSTWTHEPFSSLTTAEQDLAGPDSSSPASMLAELDKGFVPLAIAGVVPVKVSAENGPIQPGDLLTTSSLPAHAMKAAPTQLGDIEFYLPGTIIGKALEALTEDTGVIYVLVTLQ